jgi:hypothetical protein
MDAEKKLGGPSIDVGEAGGEPMISLLDSTQLIRAATEEFA